MKIGELELDFENPKAGRAGWKSNWDFEEFAVKFKAGWAGVKFTVRFTTNFIIHNITRPGGRAKNNINLFFLFLFLSFPSFPFLPSFFFFQIPALL